MYTFLRHAIRVPLVHHSANATISGPPLVLPRPVKIHHASSYLSLRNLGDDCFMNVILQLLKRSSFEDHFRTCCVGTIHEELRKILSGEKDVVGDLRRMHSYSKLHKGRNMCTTALKVLMKVSIRYFNNLLCNYPKANQSQKIKKRNFLAEYGSRFSILRCF